VVPDRECYQIEYEVTNLSGQTKALAPWEITRVIGGMSFSEKHSERSSPVSSLPATLENNNSIWYVFNPQLTGKKLWRNGSGWVAHLYNRVLLVKQFLDFPPDQAAEGESQVELYQGDEYEEVEDQGPYTILSNTANLTWQVRCYVRALPEEIKDVSPGSQQLLDFVHRTIS